MNSVLMLVLAGVLWGSEWIVTPLLQPVCGRYALFAILSGLAAAMLGGASLFARKPVQPVPLQTTLLLALALVGVPLAFSVGAGAHAIAGWPLLLFSLQPLLLSIAAGSRRSVAVALAPGATVVLLNGSVIFSLDKLPWLLLSFAAMALQAWAFRYAARHLPGYSAGATLRSAALANAFAGLLLGAASIAFDQAPRIAPPAQWQMQTLLALGLAAALATAAPYVLVWRVFAGGRLAADQVAAIQWVQTLTALLEGAWFVRARPSYVALAALAVLAACIAAELRRSSADDSVALFDAPRL